MRSSSILKLALVVLVIVQGRVAFADGLQDDVDQAVSILQRFQEMPEKAIPPAILKDAKGLAILTVAKAGFIVSARGGKGLVIARTKNGWSGPSAIGTGGAGFGFQIGAEVSEFVIVLNTPAAVKAFSKGGNVSLGGDLSVAAGPVGRNVGADVTLQAAVYSYSRTQGLFAGVSLEGTVIAERTSANTEYYGQKVKPADIFNGKVAAPRGAKKLLDVLARY
ncbi:MAG: hypothetical protein HY270_05110 [Deltaproteobacteria bacterium]|nr:hypothetical protein [Deltaproteobacteria bacterium]